MFIFMLAHPHYLAYGLPWKRICSFNHSVYTLIIRKPSTLDIYLKIMWNIWAYFVKKHCFHFSGTPSTNDKILILIFSRIWHRYFWRLFLWLFTLHNPIVLCLNKFSRNYCKFKVKVPCYIGLFMRYWYGSPEKSQSYQASIQCWVIICPPAERHFNGVLEIACWLADGCPFIAVFGSSFAHQLKKEKKSYQIWTPSDKNFLDPCMESSRSQ